MPLAAPWPIGRPDGSDVSITEGHNQPGKFAEPYSQSGPTECLLLSAFLR